MKTFDTAAVRTALDFKRLIPALARMFAQGCQVPARQVLELTPGGAISLIMPAWESVKRQSQRRYYGVKVINVAAGNQAPGLPGLFATYTLFDADSGEPLANIEADELTARRTAAASALAASKILGPSETLNLCLVGSGRVARLLPDAYAAVFAISEVRVWSRNASKAQALVKALRSEGHTLAGSSKPRLAAVSELEAAVRWADIVCCATLACDPLVQGAWLKPRAHLDLIGSFTPSMREADDACFIRRRFFVDTIEAFAKSGDLLGPIGRAVITQDQCSGTLADLCRINSVVLKTAPVALGEAGHEAGTVFKSVGTALEDLAAAILVFETEPA